MGKKKEKEDGIKVVFKSVKVEKSYFDRIERIIEQDRRDKKRHFKETNKNDIEGRPFGQWLLNPASQISCFEESPDKKLQKRILEIRDDQLLKANWDILWSWREICDKYAQVMFFKIQCLERNTVAQQIISKFPRDQIFKFCEYADKNWFIPHSIFFNYYGCLCVHNPAGEIIGLSDNDRMAAREVFSCKAYTEHQEYQQHKSSRNSQRWRLFNQRPAFHSTLWDHDLRMLETDRLYGDPTVYIRVDLRSIDEDIVMKVKRMIKNGRKEMNVKKVGCVSGNSIELALMFHDLKKYHFTTNNIAYLFQDFTGNEYIDINEKLKMARKIISNSIKKTFPY